jgi:Domain of unknown function (DUF4331)
MGDHFSSPRVFGDPAADIADVFVFPSPERPGRLALVLTVFPSAAVTSLFSDAITYRFRIRPVTIADAGSGYVVAEQEYTFDFTFAGEGVGGLAQAGRCVTPGGEEVIFRVGEEMTAKSLGLRILAGARLDPFFIGLTGVRETRQLGRLSFKPADTNTNQGQNVLSIVVEADPVTLLGPGAGPLLAVVGETVTSGGHPVRLEHTARAELKNFIMSDSEHDPVNQDIEIRDLYNSEDAFRLAPYYLDAYRARLNANLAFYDRLDGKTDWPLSDQGEHPLTRFLLADFLVVDISKPFTEDSYLEIDRAVLAGRVHATCGGRPLNDDIVDKLFTLLVGGVDGPAISDGVDQATVPASRSFPYLAGPNPSPPPLTPPFALPPVSAKHAAP